MTAYSNNGGGAMKFHVRAWGSEIHPDIDEVVDGYPSDLGWKYPYVSVAALEAVTEKELTEALKAKQGHS